MSSNKRRYHVVLARYGPKGKRYDTIRYHTKYRDTMHKRNVKFNMLQHGCQFVNECLLLLQQMWVWPVQQWNSQHGHVCRRSHTWSADKLPRDAVPVVCTDARLNPEIDFLKVRVIVTSVGCNTRSSSAVCVIIHLFNSSVHSRITLKIITFWRT